MKIFKTANTNLSNYLSIKGLEFAFIKDTNMQLLLSNPVNSRLDMIITSYTINNNSSNPLYMDVYENTTYDTVAETLTCTNKRHYSDYLCPFDIQGVTNLTGDKKPTLKF